MVDSNDINDSNDIFTISVKINKVFNALRTSKAKVDERSKNLDLDYLKTHSKSENIKVQQLVCQALLRLAETNTLEISSLVTILVSALPNSTLNQHSVIADNIIEALLIDLRRRSQDVYRCPFDIKPPQHPIILLLHKDTSHMLYLSNKIVYICQHHDQRITKNSIEFLRPVLLHIFCNANIMPEASTIWSALLAQSLVDPQACKQVQEILSWTKTDTDAHTLFTSNLLYEFVKVMLANEELLSVIEMFLYLVAVTKALIEFGFDPRKNFNLIKHALKCTQSVDCSFYNVTLILLAEMLQIVSPVFVADLLDIIKFIVTTTKQNLNFLPLFLIMDGCIQWIAHPTFAATSLDDAEFLLQHIALTNEQHHHVRQAAPVTSNSHSPAIYNNSDVVFYSFVSKLFERLSNGDDFSGKLNEFIEQIHLQSQGIFIKSIQFVLRGLFLCNFLEKRTWCRVCDALMTISANDECVKVSILMTFFYKLSNETDPRIRLILLRRLAGFGAKSRILKTLTVIANDIPKSLLIDLYLEIWKAEPRTYPYLHKLLTENAKKTDAEWELDVSRAFTIKQICSMKQQHGRELVSLLSDILNRCWEDKDELAASLALDSIAILCEHHVINAVSTWKVLNLKFRYEKRVRVVQSLCHFFGLVPELKSSTADYDVFLNEVIDRLWNYVVNSDIKACISSALLALKNFAPDSMELRHIPPLYREDVGVMKLNLDTQTEELDLCVEIPGECWIQLLQKVNHSALGDVGDLLGHHIRNEIADFRGGVYLLPEGKPEPTNLRALPNKSVLRALVHFLIQRSSRAACNESDIIIVEALRVLAMAYPKPIPPLDWCFLHEYFHRDLQMRKYCVIVAAKQIVCSGTAKRLIENYLLEFNAADSMEEDILSIFAVLPHLIKSVSTRILDDFLQNTLYCVYKNSKRESFKPGCLFERVLTQLMPTIAEPSENDENFELLFATLDKYLHILDINDKVFTQFIALVCQLPATHLERITSPSTWWAYDATKFKKVTLIRSHIQRYNKAIVNPLDWMNCLIDTVSEHISEQEFMVHELIKLLYAYSALSMISTWILHLMGRLQSIFAEKNAEQRDKCVFLLDVFMASIIVLSGCGNLVDNGETLTTSLDLRLQLFPPSIQRLYNREIFNKFDSKMFEFLHFLYNQSDVPEDYAVAFKRALICCKNAAYFSQPKVWSKFITLRRY